MQNSSNLDEPLTLNSFVLHRKFQVVQFSHKLKPLRNGPSKIINKEVTYDHLIEDRKKIHTYRNF